MSLSRYANQLQRELKANRKKAAMLAVLAIAAVWFWVPLILPKSNAAPAPVAATSAPIAAAVAPTTVASVTKSPMLRWQDLDQWMSADLETKPFAVIDAEQRNPFAAVKPQPTLEEIATAKAEENRAREHLETKPIVYTPQAMGLELSSTVVGRLSKATINGQTFELGDVIVVAQGIAFRLDEVRPAFVVLSRDGNQFRLEIRRSVMAAK